VAVAFVLVVVALAKPVVKFGKKATTNRAKSISDKLDEARKLKEEAEALLAEYKKKFADADSESAEIVNRAKKNAELFKKTATENLEIALAKKEEDALSQIKSAEESATDEIRSCVINTGTDAAIAVLSGALKGKVSAKALASSLHDLPGYLQKMAG